MYSKHSYYLLALAFVVAFLVSVWKLDRIGAQGVTKVEDIDISGTANLGAGTANDLLQLDGSKNVVAFGGSTATNCSTRSFVSGATIAANGILTTTCMPTSGAGGGLFGGVMSVAPTQAMTGLSTWLNQPTGATVNNSTQGLTIFQPSTAGLRTFAVLSKTPPSTPYTITALMVDSSYWENADTGPTANTCLGWSDGTKLEVICIYPLNATPVGQYEMAIEDFSAFNSASVTALKTYGGATPRTWMRISDNGTSVTFYASSDGENFVLLDTITKSSGYLAGNYNNVVFAQDAPNRQAYGEIMSWNVTNP